MRSTATSSSAISIARSSRRNWLACQVNLLHLAGACYWAFGTRACGTVGIRDLGNAACELKRMFVSHEARGKGLGKALIARLIQQARDMGYRHMRLDTGPFQHEAHRLYRDVGFSEIPPYYDVEPELRSWLMFMELDLVGRARGKPTHVTSNLLLVSDRTERPYKSVFLGPNTRKTDQIGLTRLGISE